MAHTTKKGQWTQLNQDNELDILYPETSADQVVESNSQQFISAAEKTKLSGIAAGAEVNTIQTVKVNGVPLTPDANRAVDIPSPTDVGSDLDYNSTTGVLALLDKNGSVLGSVDLPTELMIEDGYYDVETENIVLVLAAFELSNPQPTSETFKTNYYYTKNGDVYTLAAEFVAGTTYYNHQHIYIPASALVSEYDFDINYFTVTRVIDGHSTITLKTTFVSRISTLETKVYDIEQGTTKVPSAGAADTATKIASPFTISLDGDGSGSVQLDGSQNATLTMTLANTGVSAGTYSAVQVDAKGRVISGGQIVEVGVSGQTTPSASLAVGGLFFKDTSNS